MMKNIGQLMKQAQQMQAKMAEAQERLAAIEVEGQAGNGAVRVISTGSGVIKKVTIDPSVAGADDVEMLEDLMVAALSDAKQKVEAIAAQEMGQVTGGMKLPF